MGPGVNPFKTLIGFCADFNQQEVVDGCEVKATQADTDWQSAWHAAASA